MERRVPKYIVLSLIIIAVIAATLSLSGCLSLIGDSQAQFWDAYKKDLTYNASPYDESKIQNCTIGTCWCMVCKNNTGIFKGMTDLIGEYCYFDRNCTAEQFMSYANGTYKDLLLRPFGIGTGTTFGDFSDADRFCSERLNLAVQWLVQTDTQKYPIPDPGRAVCMLSKNVIPVYVLYSTNYTKGGPLDQTRPTDIAKSLATGGAAITQGRLSNGPVGPVVITTEIDYNDTPQDVQAIAQQIRAINAGCHNVRGSAGNPQASDQIYCFVALAPKMNDYNGLKHVMDIPDIPGQVDLIAFGINGKYARSCIGNIIKEQVMNFSRYALYTYQKPTIIPYVLFDPGTNDSVDSCTWEENTVRDAYKVAFFDGITSYNKKGIIGIAAYSFNSTSIRPGNPLRCNDCALAKNPARMQPWYGTCQGFTTIAGKQPDSSVTVDHPTSTFMILFSNASAGYCDFNTNIDFMGSMTFGSGGDNDVTDFQAPDLQDPKTAALIRCDACLVSANKTAPFKSMEGGGADRAIPIQSTGETLDACTAYSPQIELWAEQRDLDPMLVRAFIYTESKFDPCKYAVVTAPTTSLAGYKPPCPVPWGCFDASSATYDAGYDFMDYAGTCQNADPFPIPHDPAIDASADAKPAYRFLGLGLTGSLEAPYTFWPRQYRADPTSDGPYWRFLDPILTANPNSNLFFERSKVSGTRPLISETVLAMAYECNPENFNPFNVSDSLCMGTLKMKKALDVARDKVKKFHSQGLLDWDNDYDKDNVLAAYLAANYYVGGWGGPNSCSAADAMDCAAQYYKQSWEWIKGCQGLSADSLSQLSNYCNSDGTPNTANCYGISDFPALVACEGKQGLLPHDNGLDKIKAYFGLLNNCPNVRCPEGPLLVKDLTGSLPTGNVYAPPITTIQPPQPQQSGSTSTSPSIQPIQ